MGLIKMKMEFPLDKFKFKKPKGINKYFGLMFRTRKTRPLCFESKKDVYMNIHSYFVFFSFLAIWLDKHDNIVNQIIMLPFTTYNPQHLARKLIEIPL